jgi:aminoglycoside phosphotransferase (APT) family kinase protein
MSSKREESPPLLLLESLEMLARRVAPGSTVTGVHAVSRTSWNVSQLVEMRLKSGARQDIFVRRYGGGKATGAAKAAVEFQALGLLQACGVPAPEPLLADADGALTGWPGIVTRRVPGAQACAPDDHAAWARALAQMLARIHSVSYRPDEMGFLLDGNREATWFLGDEKAAEEKARYPGGREVIEAVRRYHRRMTPARPTLLHMDYWCGNVLWEGGRISGVVDWEEAAQGDPGVDVGYCMADIAMKGRHGVADVFLAEYEAATGGRVGNLGLWQLAAAVRTMPDPERWVEQWASFGDGEARLAALREHLGTFIAGALNRAEAGE